MRGMSDRKQNRFKETLYVIRQDKTAGYGDSCI